LDIRQRLLVEVGAVSVANLAERWQDGREKLFVARRLLECRRPHPDWFAEADYQPLEVEGDRSGHLCAFARNRGDVSLIVAVPRLVYTLYRGGTTADWGAAEIVCQGTELGERCSRAAACFCKSAFAFRICSRNFQSAFCSASRQQQRIVVIVTSRRDPSKATSSRQRYRRNDESRTRDSQHREQKGL
jgi:hypothetical protein